MKPSWTTNKTAISLAACAITSALALSPAGAQVTP
jgi:hypothetical protein